MRTIPRLLLTSIVATALVTMTETPALAQTLVYDVTTSVFTFFTSPTLTTKTERIQITDRGPQTDGSPRWTTESLGGVAIWDEPDDLSAPDMFLFGNHCAQIPGEPVARRVQVNAAVGGGNFAWVPGENPTNGTEDPFAAFCLKWSHQSTTTWSEQVSIGKRVYTAQPPPSPVKVFITQPRAGATVSGTVWVVLWAEGTSGSSNVFTLSVDGRQIATETTSSRGPVTLPWPTRPAGGTPVPNGTHTLTGTVRDATGNAGTTSITVILQN